MPRRLAWNAQLVWATALICCRIKHGEGRRETLSFCSPRGLCLSGGYFRPSRQRRIRPPRYTRGLSRYPSTRDSRSPMSKVNIKRTVENIRANTTVYSPIVEVVVNALQSIESTGRHDGKIVVRIQRDGQMQMDSEALADIRNFEVEDNGIGFTPPNRESFDTLY